MEIIYLIIIMFVLGYIADRLRGIEILLKKKFTYKEK